MGVRGIAGRRRQTQEPEGWRGWGQWSRGGVQGRQRGYKRRDRCGEEEDGGNKDDGGTGKREKAQASVTGKQ